MVRLSQAQTAPEILEALARGYWPEDHEGEPCPDDQIPTAQVLILWLHDEAPESVRQATLKTIFNLLSKDSLPGRSWGMLSRKAGACIQLQKDPTPSESDWREIEAAIQTQREKEDPGRGVTPVARWMVEAVHEAWTPLRREDRPSDAHPLTLAIRAWQDRPKRAQRNTRKDIILPEPDWSNIPTPDLRSEHGTLFSTLPDTTGLHPIQPDLFSSLPAVKNPLGRGNIIPRSLPLETYDAAVNGIRDDSRGGTPLALRLWVEAIVSVPLQDQDQKVRLVITLEELICALWPKGWGGPKRDGPKLERAFNLIGRMLIPWKSGRWLAVVIRNRPHYRDMESPIVIDVELPPGSQGGPLVYRPMLYKYGVWNSAAFRLSLTLPAFWNRHLTYRMKKRERTAYMRIPPRIQQVRRNKAGVILHADTHEPLYDKKGRPVKHWNDQRGWVGETERNPALKRLPRLAPSDLLEAGASYAARRTPTARRKALYDVRYGLGIMQKEGDLVLVDEGGKVVQTDENGNLLLERRGAPLIPQPPDWWGSPVRTSRK